MNIKLPNSWLLKFRISVQSGAPAGVILKGNQEGKRRSLTEGRKRNNFGGLKLKII